MQSIDGAANNERREKLKKNTKKPNKTNNSNIISLNE